MSDTNRSATNPNPLAEEALAEIAKLYTSFLETHDVFALTDMLEALGHATQAVTMETELETVKSLVLRWFDYFDARILTKLTPGKSTLSNMLAVVHLVNYHELVQTVRESMENRRMLAWICLSRVVAHELRAFHPPLDDIGNLLSTWFEKPEISVGPHTTADTVKLLYGPGVWELCALDAESLDKVPNHLYNLGLPVMGPDNMLSRVDSEQALALPNTF